MKFFKPEDFEDFVDENSDYAEHCAEAANAKLQKELTEVKLLERHYRHCIYINGPGFYKVEYKEKCKHPAEKVESYYKKPCDSTSKYFKCECGVIVTAQKFYEVEE
jgi:hypothetical protein